MLQSVGRMRKQDCIRFVDNQTLARAYDACWQQCHSAGGEKSQTFFVMGFYWIACIVFIPEPIQDSIVMHARLEYSGRSVYFFCCICGGMCDDVSEVEIFGSWSAFSLPGVPLSAGAHKKGTAEPMPDRVKFKRYIEWTIWCRFKSMCV